LMLVVSLADGSRLEETEKLGMPLDSVKPLHRAALRLLKRMSIRQPVVEVDLRAGDLGSGSGIQLALLDENQYAKGLPHERNRSLDATFQFLRKRFGADVVQGASALRKSD